MTLDPSQEPKPTDPTFASTSGAPEPKPADVKPVDPKSKPKKKRRWPMVLLAIVGLLLLLVLLAPTIISTSPVRSFVVGQINNNLNGRVEIADWKVTWTNGVEVRGVRVFDDKNSQIAEMESLTTELSLLKAMRGDLALGNTFIRKPNFTFIQNPDGSNNFARLVKPGEPKPDQPASDLPNVSGRIQLVDGSGTIVRLTGDPKTSQKASLSQVAADITIADINSPIDHKLAIAASVNGGPTGTVTVDGKAGVIANRRVNLDAANLDETIALKNLDAGSIAAFLPPDVIRQLAGVFNGSVRAQILNGKSIDLVTDLTGQNIVVAAGQFAPDEAYKSQKLTLQQKMAIALPNGLSDFQAARVTIGKDGDGLRLETDDILLTLSADAPVATLMSAFRNEKPAADGQVKQTLGVNIASLAKQLPRTLGFKSDMELTEGRLEQALTLNVKNGQTLLEMPLTLKGLAGSAQIADEQGRPVRKPINVQDVVVQLNAGAHGGGWAAPDLRDIVFTINSGFASGKVTAPTLASLQGTIDADLAKLKEQLGQFLAMDQLSLAGKVNITGSSTGDPLKQADPAKLGVVINTTGLRIAGGPIGGTIAQDLIRITLDAVINRTATGDVQNISNVQITTLTGSEAAPTVDLQVNVPKIQYVPAADPKGKARFDVPAFTIAKANVALKQVQNEFGALIPALKEYDLANGVVSITGGGAFVNGAASFDGKLATTDLNFGRYLALPATGPIAGLRQRTDVISGYTMTIDLGGSYTPLPDGGATIAVGKLNLADNQNLLAISKTGDLTVAMPASGAPTATGNLKLELDLARLNELIRRFSATSQQVIAEATSPDKPVVVTQGRLVSTVNLQQQASGAMAINMTGDIASLNVGGNQPLLTNEKITLSLKASTTAAMATAKLDELKLTSGLATAIVTADMQLKDATGQAVSPLAMVRQANATITAPDFRKLQAFMDAWAASMPAAKNVAKAPAKPLPGALAAADAKLPAGAEPEAQPSVMEQIGEVRVTELNAAGLGATVTAKEPIVLRNLADLPKLFTGGQAPASKLAAATPKTDAPATQPTAPPPPVKLAGGSATIQLAIVGDGTTLNITPDVAAQKVILSSGQNVRELGDVTFKSKVAIVSRATGAPAAAPGIAGAVAVNGQIEPLMQLSAFMAGEPAVSSYAGGVNLEQKFVTEGAVIKLDGSGVVSDFVSRDAAGKPAFTEKAIRIGNSLALDTTGVGTLSISRVALIFESSGALNIEANGRVSDFSKTRTIDNLLANVSYDAAKLWQIIRPMMTEPGTPPEEDRFKDYVVEGKSTQQFAVSGSFPAVDEAGNPLPAMKAMRSLTARGAIAIDLFKGEGLTIEKINVPVTADGGVIKVIDLTKPEGQQLPAPYPCNGGSINLAGISVDLNGQFMTLNVPPNLEILKQVQLNPAFAKFLGDLVNNPLFVPSAETKGVFDCRIVECRDLPLGSQLKVKSPQNKGYAVAIFSFSGAQLKNELITNVTGFLKMDSDSLQGSIRDGKVIYTGGHVGHDMTFVLGERQERTIHLYGDVRLADKTMMPLTMLFSSSWFGGDVAKYLPKGLPLALTGPFNAPRYNFQAAVQETIRSNAGSPEVIGNVIGNLLGGKKKDDGGSKNAPAPGGNASTMPAKPQAEDPIGGILGGILDKAAKDKERKEQEKKEKEKRERERRQRQKEQGK